MKRLLTLWGICMLLSTLSCQNNQSENTAALSDSISISGMAGDAVKLVKTAAINFKVRDVEQSVRSVSVKARQLDGMIFHQNLESVEGERKELKISSDSLMIITAYTPHADILARIPSSSLEAFLYSMADLGYYTTNSRLDIVDKSLTYLQNGLKQKNRMDVLSRPNALKIKAGSTLQAIAVRLNRTLQTEL